MGQLSLQRDCYATEINQERRKLEASCYDDCEMFRIEVSNRCWFSIYPDVCDGQNMCESSHVECGQ